MVKKPQARRFAEGTTVEVSSSRAELEKLVTKHGATAFLSAWQTDRHVIMFDIRGKRIRFDVPAPDAKTYRDTKKWQTEERRRWRALLLIIKAKLELVASGDADFESEFLAQMALPQGGTVGAVLLPKLEAMLRGEPMPPLLGMPGTATN